MIFLLRISIGAIAIFVTYASVLGLGSLFTTIAYPVMAAGVALEIGKYVSVSYAYQQWKTLKIVEALLLIFFISLMMAFTSAGVFSYLGQSYQESYSQLEAQRTELGLLNGQITSTRNRLQVIDNTISSLPTNSITGRIRLMREYETERAPLLRQLSELDAKSLVLTKTVAATEIHAGPITYIARATGLTIEQSATRIILALTLCLDPFALFLTVLMNKLIVLRDSRKKNITTDSGSNHVPNEPNDVDAVNYTITNKDLLEKEILIKPMTTNIVQAVPEPVEPLIEPCVEPVTTVIGKKIEDPFLNKLFSTDDLLKSEFLRFLLKTVDQAGDKDTSLDVLKPDIVEPIVEPRKQEIKYPSTVEKPDANTPVFNRNSLIDVQESPEISESVKPAISDVSMPLVNTSEMTKPKKAQINETASEIFTFKKRT